MQASKHKYSHEVREHITQKTRKPKKLCRLSFQVVYMKTLRHGCVMCFGVMNIVYSSCKIT